jgi:hypothetical protein
MRTALCALCLVAALTKPALAQDQAWLGVTATSGPGIKCDFAERSVPSGATSPVLCLKLALCSILRSRAQKALAKGWGVQQRTNTRGFSALALSCRRFRWLERKGKLRTVVATAVARELLAFIWAINREVMGTRQE